MMLLGALFALAGTPSTDFEDGGVLDTRRGPPGAALPIPADPHAGETARPPRPGEPAYDAVTALAASWLDVEVDFAARAREAVEHLYARRYDAARRTFQEMDTRWPSVALGPVGEALVYQARMFENLDYRYDRPYRAAFAEAKTRLQAGLEEPGYEAPEWFLYGGILGVDGIYALRKGELLAALGRAYSAVNAVAEARKRAPGFVDLEIGDGLYLYWRTVVAAMSAAIPRFEDRRMEGITRLRKVESEGVILGPAATLALTYSYIEEGHLDAALSSCGHGARLYPDNVINLLTTARVLTSMRRLEEARSTLKAVLRVDPTNQRAWYHLGVVAAVAGDDVAAEAHWMHYIAFNEVAPWYRAQAMNQLGIVAERRGDLPTARARWASAVELADNLEARRSLARTEP